MREAETSSRGRAGSPRYGRMLAGARLAGGLLLFGLTAGCGGLDDLGNLMGKQRKFYDAAKEDAAAGRSYDAAMHAIEALKIKADYADAKILLRQVTPRAYEGLVSAAQQAERDNPVLGLQKYRDLKSFTETVRQYGVELVALDYDSKFRELEARIRQVNATGAEKAYLEGEGLFEARQYEAAVAAYRRALELTPDYKEAKERIGESLYRVAMRDLEAKRYRPAAEGFKQVLGERPGYKDAQVTAARIHAAFGSYFLKAGYPRNALEEFQEALRLAPDLPGVARAAEETKRAAVRRIAVLGLSNKTGQNVEGIAVEDYISDEFLSDLQRRKSQFFEVYDRARLDLLMKELKLGLSDLVDKTSVPEVGKLKGVEYLVVGKLTQVSQRKVEPQRRRQATSYDVQLWREETYHDKNGRAQRRSTPAGTERRQVSYDEIAWSTEVAFAGSIDVLAVSTAKVAVSKNFTQRDARSGRWAENLSDPKVKSRLAAEIRQLLDAPRQYEAADVMAKRVIRTMVGDLVGSILGELDRKPAVEDPAELVLDGARKVEPPPPAAPAPARKEPPRQRTR